MSRRPLSQQNGAPHIAESSTATDAEYLDALAHLYRLFANAHMVTTSRPDGADLIEAFLVACEAIHGIDTATAPETVKDAATERITRAASTLAAAMYAGEIAVLSRYQPEVPQ